VQLPFFAVLDCIGGSVWWPPTIAKFKGTGKFYLGNDLLGQSDGGNLVCGCQSKAQERTEASGTAHNAQSLMVTHYRGTQKGTEQRTAHSLITHYQSTQST
jgi:hypothetical protein